MISPFTGGNVTKTYKFETFTFRNEKFNVKRYYYVCNDTGRSFSDSEPLITSKIKTNPF